METVLKSFYMGSKGIKLVNIFGYETRGVPGLEIYGPGRYARNIKEKIIYLTRKRRLNIPLRRFVLTIDATDLDERLLFEQMINFEFPLLLLYWYLAKLVPISKLDDCMTAGSFSTLGEISPPVMKKEVFDKLKDVLEKRGEQTKYISVGANDAEHPFWDIQSRQLLAHIPHLNFIKSPKIL